MPDQPSKELQPGEAIVIQSEAIRQGALPMWTVTHGTADLGARYAARPHLVTAAGTLPLRVHLIADDIETLRSRLPPGLSRLPRRIDDDPVIVEIWL